MTITFNYKTCMGCEGTGTFRVNLRVYKCVACHGAGNELKVLRQDQPFYNQVKWT